MKILQIVDAENWAIGQLARVIRDENRHHHIEIMAIHPKDYRKDTAFWNAEYENKVKKFRPHIIHYHYWDTAKTLSELPISDGIKKILTHHNQKNLLTHKWDKIDILVCHTQKAKKILQDAGYWAVEVIQHGIDIEKFKYNENYDPNNRLLGYVGRVVPWKGLYEILKVAKEIDSEVVMQGRIDKADYWKKCEEFVDQMDLRFGTPDDKQTEVYWEMACYVGNSIDGIEEGPLGLLEAMACGIPVITTPSGEAADIIKHGENGLLCEFENYNSLKTMVERFLQMKPEEKNTMRQNAWDTVRQMSKQVMGRRYEKLYYMAVAKKDLVSVIIPTCKRPETINNVLVAYERQSYSPIEIIVVVDDQFDEKYEKIFADWRKNNETPLKYAYTENAGYGLALARNTGIFMASGNYLIFNDDRFIPSPVAVEAFINNLSKRKGFSAIWGDKGNGKRDFIENFWAIRRLHIRLAGMFNERINEYGGQSQEIRERLRGLGFDLQYEPLAVAVAQLSSHAKTRKRYELFRSKLKLWKLNN